MANNAAEADLVIGVAAAVAFQTCKFNDGKCKGQPIIQTFERMTAFGKDQFIGCSARQPAEDKHAHIFFSIPLHVSQSTLNDIFTTQGSTSRDTEKYTGPCYYTIPPTVGLKQEKCPHVHFENGKLLNGLITRHQCPTQIIIYTPIDHSIQKAVVITTPELPHNHPPYALQKITFEATELYVEAIEAVGLLGSMVGQIDRVKQRILSGMKQKQYPEGKDIAGVKHIELCNDGNDQIDVVVTMLPDLAELVHNVTSTQHDTTYKHVFGVFNEWEIVIWHPYLCRHECTYSLILIFIELRGYSGVAIGHIYGNCETRQAYHLIWTEWFKAIERVTNKSVKFKALHKEGKHAIFMVDGSAPQMQGLGDFLLTQNDPLEKMDEFTAWCLGHEQLKVRDWWRNKLAYPWYIPALCRHFSKVPSADWDLGPTNTNLNKQSHQATNRATGVHIPLAEAIDSAFEYNKQISRELQLASENCILTNHQNTLTHWFISNNHRTSLCIERVDTADRICKEVTNIEIKLAAALEEKKIAIENVNQLRTEKKQVSGGKKINLKASGRGFPTPAVAISTEKENFPFPSLSLPSSSYHPTSAEPFYASLPPELEPPTSAEPFYASLPPELEPPPSSYNVHLSYLQQSRLYTNSEPVFPSATCPPNLRSNQ
ncbi:hypothetical protein BU17DRAFT_87119 [Hysterangium stoloniferum]|nr:hypothetical protein BU17DRAFT_87119 [Hysterangium stoloniferum]